MIHLVDWDHDLGPFRVGDWVKWESELELITGIVLEFTGCKHRTWYEYVILTNGQKATWEIQLSQRMFATVLSRLDE